MGHRLAEVLRAGEVHRPSVRTGALELSGLNDDDLRLITDAIGNGDAHAACRAARDWCALSTRHRTMCQEGGGKLWHELTRRVFGEQWIGHANPSNAQKNFYELCRRTIGRRAAKRWLTAQHPRWPMTRELGDTYWLDKLGQVLQLAASGDLAHSSAARVRMVNLVLNLKINGYDGFTNTDLLALCSMDQLNGMVQSTVDAEIDTALELLHSLANDYDVSYEDHHADNRKGYVTSMIPRLLRLAPDGAEQADRTENILGIWTGLLSDEVEIYDEETVDNQARYARAMLRHNVNGVLERFAVDSSNRNIRSSSAKVLVGIGHALNASLTMAMKDASGPHASVGRMGLVYGRD